MKLGKKILSLGIAISLMPFVSINHSITSYAAEEFQVQAKAAISVDVKTGKILYSQNADTPLPIASMTKMLTLYLVLESIREGTLSWEDNVPISDYLYELSQNRELSNVTLNPDTEYTVKDLFDATAIFSANAAAIALAEKIAETEPEFVDMMRKKVESWDIKDAYLVSSTGLNNEDMSGHIYPGSQSTDENQMSAKDMAIVAQHLINDYPEILEVTKQPTKLFGEGTATPTEMTSWNWMLPGYDFYKEGVDGLKTGTTDAAGACFTGTIEKDGWRIITVVMNATDSEQNAGARFIETGKLMDYTYQNWEQKKILSKGDSLQDLKTITVTKGKEFTVPVALKSDITVWARADMDSSKIKTSISLNKKGWSSDESMEAPVQKNVDVGTATFRLEEDDLGYLDSKEVPQSKIITSATVEKANFFVLTGRSIKNFFSNLF